MSRSLACAVAFAFLLAACGGAEDKPAEPEVAAQIQKPPAPAAPVPPVASAAMPVDNPTGNLRGDAVAGADIYSKYCVSCHGPGGKGDGPVGKTLNPPPADHTDKAYLGSLSDEDLYKVINKGGAANGKSPLMAPWGAIVKDQGIKDLIAHLRKLSNT